ncbi:MAG: hypothetical protein ACRDP5_24970 [Streptosporangiaceae bacterium]
MPTEFAISVTPSCGEDEFANNRSMSAVRSTVAAVLPPAAAPSVIACLALLNRSAAPVATGRLRLEFGPSTRTCAGCLRSPTVDGGDLGESGLMRYEVQRPAGHLIRVDRDRTGTRHFVRVNLHRLARTSGFPGLFRIQERRSEFRESVARACCTEQDLLWRLAGV